MTPDKPNDRLGIEETHSIGTSYDAVEAAIRVAKSADAKWECLAKQGRIKPWPSHLKQILADVGQVSRPEQP